MDLHDRLNWEQACTLLGCKKSMLYKLVSTGEIKPYGVGKRCRWYSRVDCMAYLKRKDAPNGDGIRE